MAEHGVSEFTGVDSSGDIHMDLRHIEIRRVCPVHC